VLGGSMISDAFAAELLASHWSGTWFRAWLASQSRLEAETP
jgi:hypothetical protein